MGILGIENRTENWMTVQHFHGMSDAAKAKLVHKLGGDTAPKGSEIKLELFWKGVRDYMDQTRSGGNFTAEEAARLYVQLFGDGPESKGCLRKMVKDFRPDKGKGFNTLKDHNYVATNDEALLKNLQGTEIDIVLETPKNLFIGEAKHESNLRGDGKLVLVHQLIRQYVTAKILLARLDSSKNVVPFVVWDKTPNAQQEVQVQFMKKHGWMKDENTLHWDEIRAF